MALFPPFMRTYALTANPDWNRRKGPTFPGLRVFSCVIGFGTKEPKLAGPNF
jgi:hypothetical protein